MKTIRYYLLGSILLTFLFNSSSFCHSTKSSNTNNYTVLKDVVFGKSITQGGTEMILKMDVYNPTGITTPKPLVVFAHGGYYLFGDKSGFKKECSYLAERGIVAASINYRLIDVEETDFVAKKAVVDAMHDMRSAVRYFTKDYATTNVYGIDPNQVFIGGYSAGAVTSLHYAYASDLDDFLKMGGKELLAYVKANGGKEGNSGNAGYPSNIKGVINFAGSIYSALLVEKDEPILLSIHGDEDDVVPFYAGTTGETNVVTEGAGLIHEQANKIGLINELIRLKGGNHMARFYCSNCLEKMHQFILSN